MTLLDMQRALSRILTDSAYRAAFRADPDAVADQYTLHPAELASLAALPWPRVGEQAGRLARDRLRLAFTGYPLAERLLRDQVYPLADEFCQAYPPVPAAGSALLAEAGRLREFVLDRLADRRLTPVWAGDVVRYEYATTSLALRPTAYADATRIAALAATPEPADLGSAVPVVGSHATVVVFQHDVADLVAKLSAGVVPDSAVPARPPKRLLFVRPAAASTVRRYALNRPTAALLGLCDGRTTVDGVLDRLADRLAKPREAIELATVGALGQLRRLGVVGYLPAA